ICSLFFFFFFFQAEDGIRDYKVTGVQTCALPISLASGAGVPVAMSRATMAPSRSRATSLYWVTLAIRSPRWIAVNRCTRVAEMARSEEHTSELQSPCNLVCRLLLEKKKQRCYALT